MIEIDEKKMENKVFDLQQYARTARQAVSEGCVLLKNDNHVLPIPVGSKVTLFGRSQFNYYKSGVGSGGLVNTRYVVGINDALESAEGFQVNQTVKQAYLDWIKEHPFKVGTWGNDPWFQEEMPLTAGLVEQASRESDTAIIILGRTAGEDRDNEILPGSYLLTEQEEAMLEIVCKTFRRTVVLLNVGNIIDMNWVERYNPSAVMYVWQGGQEGGNGVLDVLTGKISPCGKLADTIARDIQDYPSTANYGGTAYNVYAEDIYVGYRYFETFAQERVLYPFGFGLSYTTFAIEASTVLQKENTVEISCRVANTGSVRGKQAVQVYLEAPQGKLGKPQRILAGFTKTDCLAPGERQSITMQIPFTALASYDDAGKSGHKAAWVAEPGEYKFYVGEDVRNVKACGTIVIKDLLVVEQLEEALAPVRPFERLRPGPDGKAAYEPVPRRTMEPARRRKENLPKDLAYTGDLGYKLADVEAGTVSMEQFIAQLSDDDLCCCVRGEGMCSPKVTPGTAGAFGGVTKRLQDFGIPVACCADGPSGIRMDCGNIAFSMPNGTCQACTFNQELIEELYAFEGLEMRKDHVEILLGPGINIHRNPLNGRNFEYFSEDPLLAGKMAAAQLKGMHRSGVTGSLKHFACNNQESSRNDAESVVSERALREIYLRPFEIAVKEGEARCVMTSYNPVNGSWTAGSYDLLTPILRKQWGFHGIVITDWWAKSNDDGGEGDRKNLAAMIRAQNDLYMVYMDAESNSNGDNLKKELESGTLTRGELQRTAASICRYLLATPAFLRMRGEETGLDRALAACREEADDVVLDMLTLDVQEEGVIPGEQIDVKKGGNVHIRTSLNETGKYRLELTLRASKDASPLAQLPVSVFMNNELLRTIMLIGSETEWRTESIPVQPPHMRKALHFKLYFGQEGIEIREFKMLLSEKKKVDPGNFME